MEIELNITIDTGFGETDQIPATFDVTIEDGWIENHELYLILALNMGRNEFEKHFGKTELKRIEKAVLDQIKDKVADRLQEQIYAYGDDKAAILQVYIGAKIKIINIFM